MNFSDLHIHTLSGVDDGPKTEADMYAMADAAYAGETRIICAKPHFHPAISETISKDLKKPLPGCLPM